MERQDREASLKYGNQCDSTRRKYENLTKFTIYNVLTQRETTLDKENIKRLEATNARLVEDVKSLLVNL